MITRNEDFDVPARVEALREAEWQARQALLERFRSTQDERQRRALEGPIPSVTLNDCAEGGRIHEFGEAIESYVARVSVFSGGLIPCPLVRHRITEGFGESFHRGRL
jgi:hypothetical protein